MIYGEDYMKIVHIVLLVMFVITSKPVFADCKGDKENGKKVAAVERKIDQRILRKLWRKVCFEKGTVEEARKILDDGMDPNLLDGSWAPLHDAVNEGCIAIAEEILKRGANPNAYLDGGETSLHFAIEACSPKMVKLLLQYGAAAKKAYGYTLSPLKVAEINESVYCKSNNGYSRDIKKAARLRKIVALLRASKK
jgi:hypothetical protein